MGGSSYPDASASLHPSPGSRATRPPRDTPEAVLMDFERDMDRSPQVEYYSLILYKFLFHFLYANSYSNFYVCFHTNLRAPFHTNLRAHQKLRGELGPGEHVLPLRLNKDGTLVVRVVGGTDDGNERMLVADYLL